MPRSTVVVVVLAMTLMGAAEAYAEHCGMGGDEGSTQISTWPDYPFETLEGEETVIGPDYYDEQPGYWTDSGSGVDGGSSGELVFVATEEPDYPVEAGPFEPYSRVFGSPVTIEAHIYWPHKVRLWWNRGATEWLYARQTEGAALGSLAGLACGFLRHKWLQKACGAIIVVVAADFKVALDGAHATSRCLTVELSTVPLSFPGAIPIHLLTNGFKTRGGKRCKPVT